MVFLNDEWLEAIDSQRLNLEDGRVADCALHQAGGHHDTASALGRRQATIPATWIGLGALVAARAGDKHPNEKGSHADAGTPRWAMRRVRRLWPAAGSSREIELGKRRRGGQRVGGPPRQNASMQRADMKRIEPENLLLS